MSESERRLVLAPIRGVTDAAYRTNFTKFFGGFDGALAPFVSPERGRMPTGSQLRDAMPAANPLLPTIPQILTADAEKFVQVARSYLDGGCTEVNWNLGCPFPMVTKRGRGAGLLPHPERVSAFLDTVCAALGEKVSVKLRLGMERPDEVLAVLDVLAPYPLRGVTVHARTAAQMYEGVVDLEAFAACLARSSRALAYNGDIVDVATFNALTERFPQVNEWMIGRGAIANPFLPSQLRGDPKGVVDMDRLRAFHDAMLAHYSGVLSGPSHVLDKMKGIWQYLALSFDRKAKPLKRVLRAKGMRSYTEYSEVVLRGGVKWTATDRA